MSKIALVTDSSCDLPSDILYYNNISVIPLRIIYGDKEYRDGIDITPQEVYDKFELEVPKTSMPSPGDFLKKIDELKGNGYTHCIVVTISSGLSGTYNMCKLIAEEISDIKVEVIDSRALSMVLGYIVLEAANLIKNNTPFDEIVEKINVLKSKVKGFFIVDTLEYLRKGGRIGRVSAALGTMLNLKPIISIDDEGKYYSYSKIRGKKAAIEKLLEPLLKQLVHTRTNVAVLQGMAYDEAVVLAERIKSFKNIGTLSIHQISPALVVHTGPGLLGFAFYPAE
jgi:DegV family protein with EDD domain